MYYFNHQTINNALIFYFPVALDLMWNALEMLDIPIGYVFSIVKCSILLNSLVKSLGTIVFKTQTNNNTIYKTSMHFHSRQIR